MNLFIHACPDCEKVFVIDRPAATCTACGSLMETEITFDARKVLDGLGLTHDRLLQAENAIKENRAAQQMALRKLRAQTVMMDETAPEDYEVRALIRQAEAQLGSKATLIAIFEGLRR